MSWRTRNWFFACGLALSLWTACGGAKKTERASTPITRDSTSSGEIAQRVEESTEAEFALLIPGTSFYQSASSTEPMAVSDPAKNQIWPDVVRVLEKNEERWLVEHRPGDDDLEHCFSSMSEFYFTTLRFWVDPSELGQVTSHVTSVTFEDGTHVEVTPGAFVDSSRGVIRTDSKTFPMGGGDWPQAKSYVPATSFSKPGQAMRFEEGLYMGDSRIGDAATVEGAVPNSDGMVKGTSQCSRFTARPEGEIVAFEGYGRIGGLADSMVVCKGTPIYWPDGAEAGHILISTHMDSLKSRGTMLCEGPIHPIPLVFCFEPQDVLREATLQDCDAHP